MPDRSPVEKGPAIAARVAIVVVGAAAGAVMIAAWTYVKPSLEAWLREDPQQLERRARIVILIVSAFISGPALAFAVYFWRLGARARHPRLLRAAAIAIAAAATTIPILLWRLVSLLWHNPPS
jgi:hypothetical protein